MAHDITVDHELNDGTEVYRCRDCGLSYTSKGAFDIFACKSVSDTSRDTATDQPPETLDIDE